jgi:hypothetical protein
MRVTAVGDWRNHTGGSFTHSHLAFPFQVVTLDIEGLSGFILLCSYFNKSSCDEQYNIPLALQVAVYLEDLHAVNAVCMN